MSHNATVQDFSPLAAACPCLCWKPCLRDRVLNIKHSGSLMSSTIHILGFAGSLRKKSYNRATLKVAQELMPEGAELEIITLDDLPLFNQDHENNEPEVVRNFKEKIRDADALLIAT